MTPNISIRIIRTGASHKGIAREWQHLRIRLFGIVWISPGISVPAY